jgi:hypothetical protein
MVVFTSGIVDESLVLLVGWCLEYYPVSGLSLWGVWWWVWKPDAGSLVGGVVAHCWVLKDQAGSARCSCGGWGGVVASVPPFVSHAPVGGCGGLVGLLFEIWIVDASICCRRFDWPVVTICMCGPSCVSPHPFWGVGGVVWGVAGLL